MGNYLFDDLEPILETEFFRVEQDWEVPIEGFLIVSPKEIRKSILDFHDGETYQFPLLLKEVRRGMLDVLGVRTVYQFQNEDTKHNFHHWMFPRYDWMHIFGNGIESVKPIMIYAENNFAKDEIIQRVVGSAEKLRNYWN